MTRVTRLWILWPSNVIVTLTFAIIVLMISSRSEAKVIYSAVDVTVNNGHIKIDLNHDGTRDFDIQAAASGVYCGTGSGGSCSRNSNSEHGRRSCRQRRECR